MPVDHDIAEKLEDLGHATVGTDMFVGWLPENPEDCIMVTLTGGAPPEPTVDLEYPTFQVMVRNTDHNTGWTLINDIYDDLHGLVDTTIETRLYRWIGATAGPTYMGRDAKDRRLWVCNFSIVKEIE